MKRMLLITGAIVLVHCKSTRDASELMRDAFIESPNDKRHQVVYVDNDSVFRVFCGDEHRFATKVLTRDDCTHRNQRLQFERLHYEDEYKPRLARFLQLQSPETVRQEIAYLKEALDRLGQRHAEEARESTDLPTGLRSNLERQIRDVENKLSELEPQVEHLALYEAIVGSADGQTKGLLDITQSHGDFAVSGQSRAILAPFIRHNQPTDRDFERLPIKPENDAGYGSKAAQRLNTSIPLIEFTHNGAVFAFVRIRKGNFVMGSPPDEAGRSSDEQQYSVSIPSDFLLQATEVTRGQYRAIMGAYPEHESRGPGDCRPNISNDDHPVTCVSWDAANRFIDRLNATEPGRPYRLPTEAEWEFAARCGTLGPFSKVGVTPFGTPSDSSISLYDAGIAWFGANTVGRGNSHPHAVGRLKANDCGLFDMHGNAGEWVQDSYQLSYSKESNGQYPIDPNLRVIRGGGFKSKAYECRSAARRFDYSSQIQVTTGFRLVRAER